MDDFACIICGSKIENGACASILLNPPDNTFKTEGGTNYKIDITSICDNQECIEAAWSIAQRSTIGDVDHFIDHDLMIGADDTSVDAETPETEDNVEPEIFAEIESLTAVRDSARRQNSHRDVLTISERIIDLLEERSRLWVEHYYPDQVLDFEYGDILEDTMRAYVVLNNPEGIEKIIGILKRVKAAYEIELTDSTKDNINVSLHNARVYLRDIARFKKIYSYIERNPNILQKKVYKPLSMLGPSIYYMFDSAEKLGKLIRTRQKDTWLLSVPPLE